VNAGIYYYERILLPESKERLQNTAKPLKTISPIFGSIIQGYDHLSENLFFAL
jgi:hypothetical protein